MNNLIAKTRNALIQAGINPRKRLSQNFLINEELLNRQIAYAQLSKHDSVLEIGGGTGTLTEKLAEKAGRVFCIEFDGKLANYLKKKFQSKTNVTVVHGDVLKIDLPATNLIVSNLPYHISSPITFRLLDRGFQLAILMYQFEFAKRLIAKPRTKDYSRLSVNIQLQAEVEILEKVPRSFFYPMPKVDGAIVRIVPKEIELAFPIEYFRVTTRLLFNTKNKLVSSVLYNFFKQKIPKEDRFSFRRKINEEIAHSQKRVWELSIEELLKVTEALVQILERNNQLKLLLEN